MKLRATVFGYLLMVLLTGTTAEALIVDAPHNLNNNIMCGHCHSADSNGDDFWFNPPPAVDEPGYDPDVTRYNWVCARCHSAAPTDPAHRGPLKQLHSSATTGSTKPVWSTECVDCHDPHFQRQIEWVGVDGDNIYLSQGTFDTNFQALTPQASDIYSITNPTGLGGPKGTTLVGINLPNYNTTDDLDPTQVDWSRKGKSDPAYNARATDNSRGLILVADTTDPLVSPLVSPIYEIVKVEQFSGTQFRLTVNGNMTGVVHGQNFGVIYGDLLRTQVKTPTGTRRDVKFFTPKNVVDDGSGSPGAGGPVDLTAGATAPTGLCQACHTSTVFFDDATPAAGTGHYETGGKECIDCHNVIEGSAPAVDHAGAVSGSTAIIDEGLPPLGCSACHLGYSASPDGGHQTNGCKTCHLFDAVISTTANPYPDLNATTLARVPWGSNTGDGTTHSVDWPLDCLVCHAGKDSGHPQNLATAHDDNLLPTGPLCTTFCHGGPTTSANIVTIVHGDNCDLCHDSIGTGGTAVVLKDGASFGVSPGVECAGCHSAYFTGHSHGGNHDATVIGTTGLTDTTNCVGCHDAVAGGDAPDAITSPYITGNEVHADKGCDTCHALTTGLMDGQLKNPGFGRGDATVGDGGDVKWECVECHGVFAAAHGANAFINRLTTHPGVSFSSGVDKTKSGTTCNTCHQDATGNTNSLNTWNGIYIEHTGSCDLCHDYASDPSVGDNTPPLQTVRDAIKSNTVTCATCHTPKAGPSADDHGGHLITHFQSWDGNCIDCHNAADVVVDVHGKGVKNDACPKCHTNPAGSDYTRRIGANGDGDATEVDGTIITQENATCTNCHNTVAPLITTATIHHSTANAIATPTSACATFCHQPSTTHAGGHNPSVAIQNPPCQGCHTATAATANNSVPLDPAVTTAGNLVHDYCTTCHFRDTDNIVKLVDFGAIAAAMPNGGDNGGTNGGGTCTTCHTTYFNDHNHSHVAKITRTASCATADCHDANGGTHARDTANAPFVGVGEVHETVGCAGCHDVTTNGGPKAGTAAANWGANWAATPLGECTTCHNSGNFGTTHAGITAGNLTTYHTTSSEVTTSASCIYCHDLAPGSNTTAPNVVNSPYVGTGEVHVAGCALCHTPASGVIKAGYGKATGMTAAGGTCEDCHTAAYFDSHTHHDVVVPPANVVWTAADISYTDSQPCWNCHDDASGQAGFITALDTWAEIKMEHDRVDPKDGLGACITCHQGAALIRQGSESVDLASGYTDILDVVQTGTNVHCINCHWDKKSTNVHGLTYVDHLVQNTIPGQGQFSFEPIIVNNECRFCHPMDEADTGNDIFGEDLNDVILSLDLHKGTCVSCHLSQPQLVGNFAQFSELGSQNGNPDLKGVSCMECHQTSIVLTKTFHGIDSVDRAVAVARHDHLGVSVNAGGPLDCLACHTEMTNADTILTRHGACEVCHTATGAAVTTIAAGSDSAGPGVTQSCENCHTMKDDLISGPGYRLHGLTGDTGGDGVATEHNNLGASGDSDCSASGCHSMGTPTAKLALHVQGCRTCHAPDVLTITDPDPQGGYAAAVIVAGLPVGTDNGPTGSNLSQTCDQCHVNLNSFKKHGLLASDAAHPNLIGPNYPADSTTTCSSGGGMGCHAIDTVPNKLFLHPTCATCHGSADPAVMEAISDGFAPTPAVDASAPCEECHGPTAGAPLVNISGSWYNHNDPNHTSTGLGVIQGNTATTLNTDKCTVCHTGDLITGVHDINTSGGTYACQQCHSSTSALLGNASTYYNSLAPEDECIDCHTGGFDAHSQRGLGTSGHVTGPTYYDPVVGEDVNQGGDPCGTCHTSNLTTWNGILTEHDQISTQDGADSCGTCHNYDGAANGLYDKEVVGDVTNAIDGTIPAGSVSCGSCHDAKAQGGPTAGASESHGGHDATHFAWQGAGDGSTLTKQSCGGGTAGGVVACHAWGTNTNVVTQVHFGAYAISQSNNTCVNCHNTPGPVPGGGENNTGVGPNGYGTAAVPPASEDPPHADACTVCHTGATFFGNHSHSHGSSVAEPVAPAQITDNCTLSCHNVGTTGTPFTGDATNLHEAAGCAECHAATDGDLLNATYGNATANSGNGGQCSVCHANGFAGNHVSGPHTTTTHAVTTGSDTDGSAGCHTCHRRNGVSSGNPLYTQNTWGGTDGILALHQNSCVYCHDKTTGTKVNFSGSVYADLQAAMISGTDALTCLDCHSDRNINHAGHSGTQFAWTAASAQSCGGEGIAGNCHDSTVNTDVMEIHNGPFAANAANGGNKCNNCHNDGVTGDLTVTAAGNFGDGDASVANKTDHTGTNGECMVCHLTGGRTKQSIHHNAVPNVPPHNSDSANGLCENCHMDRRPAAKVTYSGGIGDYQVIKQKACRACHMRITLGVLEVLSINYAKENSAAATGNDTGNVKTVVKVGLNSPRDGHPFTVNHTVPTNATVIDNTAIDNYGTCYYCHGETGSLNYMTNLTKPGGTFSMDTPKMVPYHALPLPGAYNSGTGMANNTIGGGGINDELSSSQPNRFRGGTIWNATAGAKAYHPVGKGRLNVGYAQHSLRTKATDATYAINSNQTAVAQSFVTGLNMGKQIVRNAGATPYYVPHFDPICTAGSADPCDTVSAVSYAKISTQGVYLGFDVSATSSTGANLHLIFGGLDIATCASGGTCSWRLKDTKTSPDNYGPSQFNYGGAPPIWLVSEDGGSNVSPTPAPTR